MAKGRKGKRKKATVYTAPPKGPQRDAAIAKRAEAQRDTLGDDGAAWGALQKELLGSTLSPADIAATVMRRDPKSLDKLIARLRGQAVEPEPVLVADTSIAGDILREAMRAFRRRFKLVKLDHESKLGRSPLTSGKGAGFESILPPNQFPDAVWETLAINGELVHTGRGYYMLPKPPPALRGGG
jgi:hypothetical protein